MRSSAELLLIIKAKDLVSHQLDRLRGKLGGIASKAKDLGIAFLKLGAIIAVALAAALLAAMEAAKKEEVGIVRLNTVIKANTKNYGYNQKLVAKIIKQRQKLSFSDDELRDSAGKLITFTQDVNRAMYLQTAAMDLARLRGISLTDATDLLVRAMGGNKRALDEIGISVGKNATAQEILMAIQKAAAGQAVAYSKTAQGAQERFHEEVQDFVEDVGTFLLPIVREMFRTLKDKLVPWLKQVADKVMAWAKANKPLIDGITTFVGGALKKLVDLVGGLLGFLSDLVGWFANNKPFMKGMTDFFRGLGMVIGGIERFLGNIIHDLKEMVAWLKQAWKWLQKVGGVPTPSTPGAKSEKGQKNKSPFPETAVSRNSAQVGNQTIILQISGQEVGRVVVPQVNKSLFYELQRAAPTSGRV